MNVHAAEPAGLQRTQGAGRVDVHTSGGRTRLAGLYQQGAAKIRLPRAGARPGLEAVLINTAGGLTGGDRLCWQAQAGADSALTLTTQACEKVYRASGGVAAVQTRLAVQKDADLAWLPQETILFNGAHLTRSLEADLEPGARLLACEAVIFGRSARGESVTAGRFADRWQVRCAGTLVHREDIRISGSIAEALARPAIGGGMAAFATVLLVAEDAPDRLERVRAALADSAEVHCAASALSIGPTGKLLARMAAKDGYCLRKALLPVLAMLNGAAGMPRIWST